MPSKSKSKKDAGELIETPAVEETPAEVKVSKRRVAAIQISPEKFLAALKKAEGKAKITALYENYDKTGLEAFSAAKVKTAIRACGLALAKEGKVQAVHENGKRQFTFETA